MTTKAIIVAEEPIFDLLASSGADWDLQHRVSTVSQMWDHLSGGRLDTSSRVMVFSDSLQVMQQGELESAIAVMAPHAAVIVIAWQPEHVDTLRANIRRAAAMQPNVNPDAPVYIIPVTEGVTSAEDIMDAIAASLASHPVDVGVNFPAEWAFSEEDPEVLETAQEEEARFDPDAPSVGPDGTQSATIATPRPAPAPPSENSEAAIETRQAALGQEIHLAGRSPLPGQRTYAVTSSKGGSGKSSTAMMLATTIAWSSRKAFEAGLIERPLRVVLVDMDTRDGQVGSIIGQYAPTALNIRFEPNWDAETIERHLIHDDQLGIDCLLAPVRPRTADMVGPDFYRHIIRMLKTTHDVVIMDTSVNYLDPLSSTVSLPESTAVLFVTTLAGTSVQGMARALTEITDSVENGGMGVDRRKIGIVVNQSVPDVGMTQDKVLAAGLGVSLVGVIPLATKDVLLATNYRRMHILLRHPLLGPAYFKLAQNCMPHIPLVEVYKPPTEAGGQQGKRGRR